MFISIYSTDLRSAKKAYNYHLKKRSNYPCIPETAKYKRCGKETHLKISGLFIV